MMAASEKRIWFLQLSRAVACVLIIYVHWITFIYTPNNLQDTVHLNLLSNYPHLTGLENYLIFMSRFLPANFSEGYFALGLFFLISGYVIPLSIARGSPIDFLIRRLLRIYPTMLVGILVVLTFLTVARLIQHLPPQVYDGKTIAANIFLIRNFFRFDHIEPVLWTVEIEAHFYLIYFLLALMHIHKKALSILIVPIVLAFLSHLNAVYINFTLIGTCLYYWNEENWSGKKTAFMIFMLTIFDNYFLMHFKQMQSTGIAIYVNHIYALSFFVILLLLNQKIMYSKTLDKIANMSYSLYIFHSITGYISYHLIFSFTHQVLLSVVSTFALIISLSLFVHYYVELPFIVLSKKIVSYRRQKKALACSLQLEEKVTSS